MRLAVIGPTHPFRGGIAHHTTLLAGALRQRHDVLFVSFRGQYPRWVFPGRTDRDPSPPVGQGPVEYLMAPLRPWTWRTTAARLAAFGPRLTVIAWWVPFWAPSMGSLVRWLGGRGGQVLFLCHNVTPHESSGRPEAWLTRYALGSGDAFIVHSATDEQRLRRLLKGRVRPLLVRRALLPDHAIAPPVERAAARRRLGLGDEEKVALFFGFVRPYKGLDVLVEAAGLARRGVPELRLIAAGEFWLPAAGFRALADTHGLGDRLLLDDRYVPNEDAADYFCAADVVVLPYRQATQSGVVTLASRFCAPVIATRVGGLPEAVQDGRTGLVVEPGSAPALAEALVRVLGDDAFAARLRAGVAAERHRFDWSALVGLVETLAAVPEEPLGSGFGAS